MQLLILADDFTGALDTGVQFANAGASTKVVVGDIENLQAVEEDVLVIDTETRHVNADEAYASIYAWGKRAKEADVAHIYKKTDSALRGNVGAEIAALLASTQEKQIAFLPAFPKMNRIVENGMLYVDGVPVHESPFGKDPFEPVRYAKISKILAGQTSVQSFEITEDVSAGAYADKKGILIFDGSTDEDLKRAGSSLLAGNSLSISAGCAGFGAVLADLLVSKTSGAVKIPKLDPKMLIVCGSVNPITVRQVYKAVQAGFAHINLTPQQKLEDGYWQSKTGEHDLEQMRAWIEENPLCILDSNDAGSNELTRSYAAELGLDIEAIRQRISQTIGYLVGALFAEPSLGTLFITGGDTLLQCMNCLGIRELEPVCEMEKGVVLSRFTYQECTRYVISKSGGFGEEALLVDLAQRISQESESGN